MGQKLLDAVRTRLQLPPGDAAADAAALRQHSMPAAGTRPGADRGGGGGGSSGQHLNIGRLSGNKGGDGGGRPTGKHTVFGGDDLDDDFALQVRRRRVCMSDYTRLHSVKHPSAPSACHVPC